MSAKAIRNQIKSIQNTRKITSAMEMVAASKLRSAQSRMLSSRAYAQKIAELTQRVAKAHPEYVHTFLKLRPVKRVGLILVTSDRGLCGGLNTSLLKNVIIQMQTWALEKIEVDLCLIGSKGQIFFQRFGQGNVIAKAQHLGENVNLTQLIGIVKILLDAFQEEKVDSVFIAYNTFINTLIQKPVIQKILPIIPIEDAKIDYYWDYIYEPNDAKVLMDILCKRYIESQVYQAVVENIACEQVARMMAMQRASDNAKVFIEELQLAYNKARQAAITRELAEIVAGADAV